MPAPAPTSARPSRAPVRALLGWLVVLATGVAAALAMGSAGAVDDDPGTVQLERGRNLYTANCANCHGSRGAGGQLLGRSVPAIDNDPIALLRVVMAAGRMPPDEPAQAFDSSVRGEPLPPEQREAILAYTAEEFGLSGDVDPPPPGDPARGQALYTTNCAACHGSTGAGGVAGRGAFTPSLTEYDPQTIADAVRTGPFAMPQFAQSQITDQEVGHIAAFLDTVQEEEFAPLWDQELGPVYASMFAAGLMAVVVVLIGVIAGRPIWFPPDHARRRARGRAGDDRDQDEQDQG